MIRNRIGDIVIAGAAILGSQVVIAQDVGTLSPASHTKYSPYLEHDYPNQVLFGDTHLHTAYSADAGLVGATTTPDDAYRFAKGEQVTSSNGVEARLQRPLDFLVVADHAENLGLYIALDEANEVLEGNAWAEGLRKIFASRSKAAMDEAYIYWASAFALNPEGGDPMVDSALMETMWERMTEASELHNDPGAFTALIGYEWTSGPGGNNLHRNVIFRDGKDKADQVTPFSAYDSMDPEDLWAWMQRYEDKTGGRVLAIPHNGNLSNGLMFDDVTLTGKNAIDSDYAERRMRWEPIYEITQIKGDGEAHPILSPDDAFADYGTWDIGSFGTELKTPDMLPREYAREAWKRGIAFEAKLGVNPFKFGVVGSTDSHTGLSTSQEDNFFGKAPAIEPTADPIRLEEPITGRATPEDPSDDQLHGIGLASGLAAVWARANTREAIWDALNNKEVYATTGTRLRVRVFAGTDFSADDLYRSDFARVGYESGVPMGGDLAALPKGKSPGLLIRALRDPDGANIDRVQVIKGWVDKEGELQERVYDVACSDGRTIIDATCDSNVGSTVDVATATYTNTIGEPFLESFWEDLDFDPALRAFYYVRVLEIPTPRWTTYDAAFFGIDPPDFVEPNHQERAYTSPIWYTPESDAK